jgi:heptosyltransferase-2
MRFAGIPRRFGFQKEGRSFVLTDPVPPPKWKSDRHEVFYYLELIKAVEQNVLKTALAENILPSTELFIPADRKQQARDFLTRKGADLSHPLVAMGPGSTNSTAKRWPFERFAEVGDQLTEKRGANIILLGGPGDEDVAAKIAETMHSAPLDLTAKTSLGDAADIISVCDLMISNDMGLAHLGPAVGTRTLVIFGPTNPETTRPFSDIAEVVRNDVDCSPCMLRECPIDHRCMNWISAERLLELALSKLNSDETNIVSATSRFS